VSRRRIAERYGELSKRDVGGASARRRTATGSLSTGPTAIRSSGPPYSEPSYGSGAGVLRLPTALRGGIVQEPRAAGEATSEKNPTRRWDGGGRRARITGELIVRRGPVCDRRGSGCAPESARGGWSGGGRGSRDLRRACFVGRGGAGRRWSGNDVRSSGGGRRSPKAVARG